MAGIADFIKSAAVDMEEPSTRLDRPEETGHIGPVVDAVYVDTEE